MEKMCIYIVNYVFLYIYPMMNRINTRSILCTLKRSMNFNVQYIRR